MIDAKIAGQGSAVDVGGALPKILTEILNAAFAGANVQSDWNENDNTDPSFIKNKPIYELSGASHGEYSIITINETQFNRIQQSWGLEVQDNNGQFMQGVKMCCPIVSSEIIGRLSNLLGGIKHEEQLESISVRAVFGLFEWSYEDAGEAQAADAFILIYGEKSGGVDFHAVAPYQI